MQNVRRTDTIGYLNGHPLTNYVVDIISLLTGFLGGAAAAAAGQYLADKYTDQRRDKQKTKNERRLWRVFERDFPSLVGEMRLDFISPENRGVRAFYIKSSNATVNNTDHCFEYHTDKHQSLQTAICRLQQGDFITEITPGNCPKYRIHESMANILMGNSVDIFRQKRSDWAIIAMALLIGVMSLIVDYINPNDHMLFARSGSFFVLAGLIVEFNIMKYNESLKYPRLSIAAHLCLLFGTIIWGYGDLLWPI